MSRTKKRFPYRTPSGLCRYRRCGCCERSSIQFLTFDAMQTAFRLQQAVNRESDAVDTSMVRKLDEAIMELWLAREWMASVARKNGYDVPQSTERIMPSVAKRLNKALGQKEKVKHD